MFNCVFNPRVSECPTGGLTFPEGQVSVDPS